ncbi:hypothetical protein PENSPDRAFT_574494 [Peniophora sp. CONT]|nr:hypothetical protein PENSPDRAFT_574494 [Peniophora sp. CONT]
MPPTLKGSCHCGAVAFSVQSNAAVPYEICFCSICRKVGGPGGATHVLGNAETLEIQGRESISIYYAVMANRGQKDEQRASSERCFCKLCGTTLWLAFAESPDLIYPFASAIDTPLEPPEEMTVIWNESKPEWVRLPEGPLVFDGRGSESVADWHKRNGKWVE